MFQILSALLVSAGLVAGQRNRGRDYRQLVNNESGSCPTEYTDCRYAFSQSISGTYKIFVEYQDNQVSARCLSLDSEACDELEVCESGREGRDQSWDLVGEDNGSGYQLKNAVTGYCLAFDSANDDYLGVPCDASDASQVWTINPPITYAPTLNPTAVAPEPTYRPSFSPVTGKPTTSPPTTSPPTTSPPTLQQPTSAPFCLPGKCDEGYCDKTYGNTKWWACGIDCPGGKYLTDGYCNCACVEEPDPCLPQGPCYDGYSDKTQGDWNYWACGVDCPGGRYYTDGVCNCACIKDEPDCIPDSGCYDQGPCDVGFMDTTGGHANWWACGIDCPGGKYWTDGACNCACKPAGMCSSVPTFYNFHFYRTFPSLSFIRSIGVLGDFLAVAVLLSAIAAVAYYCFKKSGFSVSKYGQVSLSYDSASEVEKEEAPRQH